MTPTAPTLSFPPFAKRGEVSASYADGGVMGRTEIEAHDPSAPDYGGTSPASPGRRSSGEGKARHG
jgi:hypothetical protein